MAAGKNTVKAELQRAAWEYGKLGLLVDDSPESATRVARALYGGEVLPKWWRQVRSLECARLGMEALQEVLQDSGFEWLRALVVVDRYLPLRCGGGKAVPWDWADYPLSPEEKRETELLCQRVRAVERSKLEDTGSSSRPACYMLFVTSFPAITARTARQDETISLEWQTRSVELLQEERRKIQAEEDWKGLLRFGPEEAARIKEEAPPKGLFSQARAEEARWRASTWQENIDLVAGLLRSSDPVILLTGAGASLAASRTAPGMPPTHVLLQEACERVRNLPLDEGRSRGSFPDAGCACQSASAPVTRKRERWKAGSGEAPIDWLVKQSETRGGVAGVDWKLEEVFSEEVHKEEKGRLDKFRKFHSSFRDALHRWDYGISYQHWLLARLPWAGIITTNFDGFHERATQMVTTLPWLEMKDRSSYLQRGMLVDPPSSEGGEPQGKGLLFKPYGNLYAADGTLALDLKEISKVQKYFRRALTAILRRGKRTDGAFVVMGHSMRDASIERLLEDIEEFQGDSEQSFALLWIDPSSYQRSSGRKTPWEKWMWERASGGKSEARGGPVPATALEFLSDLWAKYHGL